MTDPSKYVVIRGCDDDESYEPITPPIIRERPLYQDPDAIRHTPSDNVRFAPARHQALQMVGWTILAVISAIPVAVAFGHWIGLDAWLGVGR